MNNLLKNDRLSNFNRLREHAFYSKLFLKLSKSDIDICKKFLIENEDLSNNDFEHKLNRMFINSTERPKLFALIQEILSVSK